MQTAPGDGRRLLNLQILRAIAASLVVIDHAIEHLITRGVLATAWAQPGWFLGWLGVAVFFVISGLIMKMTTVREFGQPGAARRFLRRRAIRVVPLYWLATLVYAILRIAAGTKLTVAEFIQSLLFVPYRVGNAPVMRPIVGQGWTLNFEIFFYLLFALCLLLPRRQGLGVLLLGLPVLVAIGCIGHPPTPYLDPVTRWQFWSDPWLLLFVLGMLAGLGKLRAPVWPQVRWPVAASLALLAAALLIFVWAGLRLPLPLPWQALFGIMTASCVILCAHAMPPPAMLATRLCERAGDSSYSMYLFHPLLLAVLVAVGGRIPLLFGSPALFVVLAVVLCNLGGYAIYTLVERPLGGLLRIALTAAQPRARAAL